MYHSEETLDDLLHVVLTELLKHPFDVNATRGNSSEVFGVLLKLNNPLARLSRTETKGKPFSALGEFLWYLSKRKDLGFIEYYISNYNENAEEDGTINGGYGPRLFNMHEKYNQVDCIIKLLKERPNTRRAVIQLIDAKDTERKYKDITCTCTLQFAIRDNKLNMFTSMRSNDAMLGLPHDIFCFTMLQEVIARSVGVELGTYNHAVASLHLYEKHKQRAEIYLSEGYQSTKMFMPSMPEEDPWQSIDALINIERIIRLNGSPDVDAISLDPYWKDFVHLLQIHSFCKKNTCENIDQIKNMTNPIYRSYIENRLSALQR